MQAERPDEILGVVEEVEAELRERVLIGRPGYDELISVGEADAIANEGQEAAYEEREQADPPPEHRVSKTATAKGELVDERDEREERSVLFREQAAEEAEPADDPGSQARSLCDAEIGDERAQYEDESEEQVSIGNVVHSYACDGMSCEERSCREAEEGVWCFAVSCAKERSSEEEDQPDGDEM